MQSEHERYLTEKYAKKPVIVMNYPKAIKAFYMRENDNGRTVALSLTLPRERGREGDLRRYRTVPHAGFGLGFERTLAYVTGLANMRDAIPFPTTPGNARY